MRRKRTLKLIKKHARLEARHFSSICKKYNTYTISDQFDADPVTSATVGFMTHRTIDVDCVKIYINRSDAEQFVLAVSRVVRKDNSRVQLRAPYCLRSRHRNEASYGI